MSSILLSSASDSDRWLIQVTVGVRLFRVSFVAHAAVSPTNDHNTQELQFIVSLPRHRGLDSRMSMFRCVRKLPSSSFLLLQITKMWLDDYSICRGVKESDPDAKIQQVGRVAVA